jgi:formiminotetrahydrofolate cyclodeaminase
VTICHTQTASLKDALKDCEIVVAATGKPKLLDGNILQPGQVVIDAGIAELDGKLCGDLDVTSTATILQAYTPVPGGVGPVTTAFILKNLIRAIEIQQQPSPDSLWETPLQKFIAQTASDRPTPGGGSVACVSASMGFGLLLMALRISSKRKDIDESNNIFALSSKLEAMLESAKNSAIEDIECFNEYMSALSLRKSTDEEKNARKKALADATNKAIEVPLNACANILEGLHLAKDAAMFSNRFVVSDVGAGSSLLYGAIEANLWNILINAQSLSEDRKAEFLEKIASTRRQAQELFEQVKELVASKIEQK